MGHVEDGRWSNWKPRPAQKSISHPYARRYFLPYGWMCIWMDGRCFFDIVNLVGRKWLQHSDSALKVQKWMAYEWRCLSSTENHGQRKEVSATHMYGSGMTSLS